MPFRLSTKKRCKTQAANTSYNPIQIKILNNIK